MTEKQILKLSEGDKVQHKQLGVCTIKELHFGTAGLFGVAITPDEKEGCILLSKLSGMPFGTPLLETSYRLLKPIEK